MPNHYDTIIVGLGAMGAAAAWQLAARRHRVLGLEQFSLINSLGSSLGHTRMIRLAYYEHPDYVPLLRRAYDLWDQLELETSEKILYRTGGIYTGPPEGEVVPGCLRAARDHHLPHEHLSHTDLRKAHPLFQLPENYTGVWEPAAGFLLCEKALALFARRALESGATLHAHEPVTHIDLRTDGVSITTPLDTYHAENVIFTAGAWTTQLLTDLNVPLTVTRQTLGWLWPQSPQNFALGHFPVWGIEQPAAQSNTTHAGAERRELRDQSAAPDSSANQNASTTSLLYGFPMLSDVPGLKLARHGRGPATDPDTVSRTPTADDRHEIQSIAHRYLPTAIGPTLSLRICLYTNSPDGHFILDHHPHHPRALIAAGFSGHGFKFAPVIGEILADLATTNTTQHPIHFLNLNRFYP